MTISEEIFLASEFLVSFEHNGKKHKVSISPKGNWHSMLHEDGIIQYIVFISIDEDGNVYAEVEYRYKENYAITNDGFDKQSSETDDFILVGRYQDGKPDAVHVGLVIHN
jgi:hypothetical protein